METSVSNFFIEANSVRHVAEEEYKQAELVICAAKAFARSSYQSVYVIDYFKQNFLYVSDSLAYLCGVPSDEIKNLGYKLYTDYVPHQEQQMLLEINKKGFELYNEIPYNERLDYTISYDFHLKNGRKQTLVNHKLTPIKLDSDGRVWLALCTISLSARNSAGHIVVKKTGGDTYYEYLIDKHKWVQKKEITLSETEHDMLSLSTQGYTITEIADKLCKSVDGVKQCRRNLFAHLGVKNITEALFYASNYGLLYKE